MAVRTVVGVVVACCAFGLIGCTGEPSAGRESAGSAPVIAPGKPGEQARTLSPDEARNARVQPTVTEADVRYLRMMITHHEQAIEMTDLVDERVDSDDVRRIAARIADAQRPEITAMSGWLKRHGHPLPHGEHGTQDGHAEMPGMASPDQLTALGAAVGTDFDRLFLRLMISHHEGAVTMARDVLSAGSHELVAEMAQDVIATQTKEIALMRALLTT
ncbi:MAG: DUF305 domain-containing protein [Pseudonocardiaceae bacterium]|nr:DUF305 domain-containing protein [Pseudonocardiaceae bacterium]